MTAWEKMRKECREKDPTGICRRKAAIGVWKEGVRVNCVLERDCPLLCEKARRRK